MITAVYHIHSPNRRDHREPDESDEAEAKGELAQAKTLAPNLTIKWFKTHGPTPKFVEEGLRKAGLQEELRAILYRSARLCHSVSRHRTKPQLTPPPRTIVTSGIVRGDFYDVLVLLQFAGRRRLRGDM
jgi:hypothetical protein